MKVHKFGRYSEEGVRQSIQLDRLAAGEASKGWHQSHGCVVDQDGTILTWIGGQQNLYSPTIGVRDPDKELKNARFMVRMRTHVDRRCDMMDAMLDYIADVDAKYEKVLAELEDHLTRTA